MSETTPAPAMTILLWGETATGKSSLLAAALYHESKRLPSLDLAQSGLAANAARLNRIWRDLREGRLPSPTVDSVDINLSRSDGSLVALRDVRGSLVGGDAGAIQQAVQNAAAILFVMELRPPDPGRQLHAIDGLWDISSNLARGLVFTKCELHLEYDDPAWNGQAGWWRQIEELRRFDNYIERFGDAVFPTSVFGYHKGSKAPAVTLGEFGELRPIGINPLGVAAPFVWSLDRVAAP